MSENTALLYIVIAFVVMSLGLFFLLAWKFGKRSGEENAQIHTSEIHVSGG